MGTHPIFESDFDCLTDHSSAIGALESAFNQLAGELSSRHTQEEFQELSATLETALHEKAEMQCKIDGAASKMEQKHAKYVKLQEKYESLKKAYRELAEHLSSSSSSSSDEEGGGWSLFGWGKKEDDDEDKEEQEEQEHEEE